MNTLLKNKLAGCIATLLLVGVSGSANAAFATFADFTIQEGVIAGAYPNTVTGDKFNGGYKEELTIGTPNGSGIASFGAVAFATFSALYDTEGANLAGTQLGSGVPSPFSDYQYLLRGTFVSTGTVDLATGVFSGSTAEFKLYSDASSNTNITFGTTAFDPFNLTNASDDKLLGSATLASLLSGTPSGASSNTGNFDFIWEDFALTPFGKTFFTSPASFYVRANPNGDFDNAGQYKGAGTFQETGDVSLVFASKPVPEPATLALLGLGFMGLSLTRRKIGVAN